MKQLSLMLLVLYLFGCPAIRAQTTEKVNNKELDKLFDSYYEEELKLFPILATFRGDNRYNDLLTAEFTDSYRIKLKAFNTHYLTALSKFKRADLSESDRLSYDIFKWSLNMNAEGLMQKDNRMPFNQFIWSVPLNFAQLGSGTSIQPFRSIKDYHNWISRATAFSAWADSAIVYFRKGMAEGIVLPKTVVTKMIPQMESFVAADAAKSIFYSPITNLPQDFSAAEKQQLTTAYVKLINEQLVPAYKKLHAFLQTEYLPKARTTSGLSDLPGGAAWYNYQIRVMTTTNKTADEVYNTGLAEVKRIRAEMEKVKNSVGFKGDLKAFFEHLRTDPKFFPYKTPEEVLTAYRAIQQKIDPNLSKMFRQTPKTPFEIRQTEAFRAASAAAQYNPGLADGSRPGIFYVPIVDATKESYARESLFIHEAIPGHHYQVMLQRENKSLPDFRRFSSFVAYGEGWGLYSESLGKELGLYTDPYQQIAALGDEIHRAIRLVVDPGLHTKGWTREKAITYMLENGPISEQFATSEIERYMAVPGQALAYKIGELKLQELRKKYTKQLGQAFTLAAFHDEVLKDGRMPLDILEQKMDEWAKRQKK
ncbi:hypothetical protein AAE02nite_25720 [Adhaeribacter aerolatus]|uniref:DUF885 domain-containing protein n=1 Tax=Adhaeribacter aerolatus TaxID=670289 RepID=A0A512AYW1_9BACT|nr:DUF885 domain-containing protein [Adhaeribacter aerolatus]GEO04908.1 hypothetical protein AAE02nite_25720 [Adhaeribacter aerolatus]